MRRGSVRSEHEHELSSLMDEKRGDEAARLCHVMMVGAESKCLYAQTW